MPGDGYDEIHWKATARRGQPIVNQFEAERSQNLVVLLDAGYGNHTTLRAQISDLGLSYAAGILSTADDQVVTLNDFTREVQITPLNYDGTASVNPNLRQVTVIVRYKVGDLWRTYRLVTFVSSYS